MYSQIYIYITYNSLKNSKKLITNVPSVHYTKIPSHGERPSVHAVHALHFGDPSIGWQFKEHQCLAHRPRLPMPRAWRKVMETFGK